MANDGTVKIGTELDDSGFKAGLSKLGSIAKTALTGVVAGIGAASTAVGFFGKQSLDAYARYEQLVGGVDKLFGDSSKKLQEYAANAYKTSGMSANQYMEQATQFSASLISSLGGDTEQATELANVAMTAMSDNVNVFGSNMEDVQNAYQGFAKQNYTMLDNLRLGYGGTQEEMKRLVSDASSLKDAQKELGLTVDGNSLSFDNIIKAIQVTQYNMGILGTTSNEAASTIEGSVTAAKAAFDNLLVGIADDSSDFDALIENFVESFSTAAQNILPRFYQILQGIGDLVQQLAPIIANGLPSMLESILPSMVSAGAQLIIGIITGLISATPSLIQQIPIIVNSLVSSLSDQSQSLMDAGNQLLSMVGEGITQYIPELISRLPDVIVSILDFLTENFPSFAEKGSEFLENLTNGILSAIPVMVEKLPQVISSFFGFLEQNFPSIVEKGSEILSNLANGIGSAIVRLIPIASDLIAQLAIFIASNFPSIVGAGADIILSLIGGILSEVPYLLSQFPAIVSNIATATISSIPAMIGAGIQLISSIWDGISSAISWISENAKSIGGYIVDGVWKGIQNAASNFTRNIKKFFSGIVDSVKNVLGIHSPSRVFAEIGKFSAQGVGVGWEDEFDGIKKDIEGSLDFSKSKISAPDIAKAIPEASMAVSFANALTSPTIPPHGVDYAFSESQESSTASLVSELRAIKDAITEGKIMMVDKQVLAKVTNSVQKNNNRALGVGTY